MANENAQTPASIPPPPSGGIMDTDPLSIPPPPSGGISDTDPLQSHVVNAPSSSAEPVLSSYGAATKAGFDSVAQSTIDSIKGAVSSLSPKPQDNNEQAALGAGGIGGMYAYRLINTLKGMGRTALQAHEIAGAVHDINASQDPLGTYLKILQKTSAEGAGQALTALAGEGVVKSIPFAGEAVSNAAAKGATAAKDAAIGATDTVADVAKQIVKGKNVVNPQTSEALRAGVKAGGDTAGLNTVQGQSLRDVMEEPIEKLHAQAKESYKQVDDAAGFDVKAEKAQLANDQYKMKQLGNTDADVTQRGNLTESINDSEQRIADAEAKMRSEGIDPKLADAQFKKASAAEEFRDKIFHNQSVIKGDVDAGQPETVDVDAAVRESQKLMDKDKFGDSRLEQFMGKDGAAQYMKDLRSLQQQGVHAMKVQAIAKMVAKVAAHAVGYGAAGALGYETFKP